MDTRNRSIPKRTFLRRPQCFREMSFLICNKLESFYRVYLCAYKTMRMERLSGSNRKWVAFLGKSLYNGRMEKRKIRINEAWLTAVTILYFYLPIFLFLFTWVKWYFAVIVSALLIPAVARMVYDYRKDGWEELTIGYGTCTTIVILVLLFAYYMGYTGGAPQCADWNKHNAVLHDLTTRKWPVYYETRERSMLTYYIAQYLVPAMLGKLCASFSVTQWALFFWNGTGILLVLIHLFYAVRAQNWKKQLGTLAVFFFFGGMLPIAQQLLSILFGISIGAQYDYFHFLNIEGYFLQYRSNLVSMRWVFPQCIVPWIAMLMLTRHRERIEHYAVLVIPVLLFGILPTLGLVVFAVVYVCKILVEKKGSITEWKRLFSPWNLMTLFGLGSVLLLYFGGNIFSDKPKEIGFQIVRYGGKHILIYLLFCLFMFGIYALCVFRKNSQNVMFWTAVASLTIIPLFHMGSWNDFCMGVSIPALFYLMTAVLRFLWERAEDMRTGMIKGALIVCLFIGAIYPVGELYQIIADDRIGEQQVMDLDFSMQSYADRFRNDIGYDMQYNYYTYDVEDDIFVQFLARKKKH